MPVERINLAPGLSTSRVLTGLWQIADMERDGRTIDLDAYGVGHGSRTSTPGSRRSTWPITTGRRRTSPACSARPGTGTRAAAARSGCPSPGRHPRGRPHRRRRGRSPGCAPSGSTCCSSTRGTTRTRSGSMRCSILQELKHEGLIGHLGFTNVDTAHLHMALASGIAIVSNQVAFSLLDSRAAGTLSALCARDRSAPAGLWHGGGGWLSEQLARPARARLGARPAPGRR